MSCTRAFVRGIVQLICLALPDLPDLPSQRILMIILVRGCSECHLAHLVTVRKPVLIIFLGSDRTEV